VFNWIDRKTTASKSVQHKPSEQRSEYKTLRLWDSTTLSDYTRLAADYHREGTDRPNR